MGLSKLFHWKQLPAAGNHANENTESKPKQYKMQGVKITVKYELKDTKTLCRDERNCTAGDSQWAIYYVNTFHITYVTILQER